MECSECGGDTKVLESRVRPSLVYRRRECLSCGYRFTTYERESEFDLTRLRHWLSKMDSLLVEVNQLLL